MIRIISHRGAAGLVPENTLEGIETAKKYNVAYIEVDVRPTADNALVLVHDDSLYQIARIKRRVSELKLKEIDLIQTSSGHPIPTLQDALDTAGKTPLLIDCKGDGWAKPLAVILKKHRGVKPIVASDDFEELLAFQRSCPRIKTFFSELTKPYEAIQTAKVLKFSGVCLFYSIYSPLVYFLAKRSKLEMTMFTVNKPSLARFLHILYPKVMITTDYPNKVGFPQPKRTFKK